MKIVSQYRNGDLSLRKDKRLGNRVQVVIVLPLSDPYWVSFDLSSKLNLYPTLNLLSDLSLSFSPSKPGSQSLPSPPFLLPTCQKSDSCQVVGHLSNESLDPGRKACHRLSTSDLPDAYWDPFYVDHHLLRALRHWWTRDRGREGWTGHT